MIRDDQRDEDGKYKFPYTCPICGADLSPEDNIDMEVRGDKFVSILRCGNKGCKFSKILDEISEADIEDEIFETEEDIFDTEY